MSGCRRLKLIINLWLRTSSSSRRLCFWRRSRRSNHNFEETALENAININLINTIKLNAIYFTSVSFLLIFMINPIISNVSTCSYRSFPFSFSRDFSFLRSIIFYEIFISWQGGWRSLRYNTKIMIVAPHTKTLSADYSSCNRYEHKAHLCFI